MSNPQVFQFDTESVRVIDRNGSLWWVASDVCRVLHIANHRDAVSRLAEDEQDKIKVADANGRNPQKTIIINESGLFSLIMTSRKPEAKRLRKWVTSEVLPALRKTGKFQIVSGKEEFDEDPLLKQVKTNLDLLRK